MVGEDLQVRAHFTRSQASHAPYRGVVPEIAAREHLSSLPAIVGAVLDEAGATPAELAGAAATAGPGLAGALLVGLSFAKSYAYAARLPFLRVNHLEAHLHSIRLVDPDVAPPFLALLVSGGHTELVEVASWTAPRVLGRTRDDAAGEAFDKVAALLDLPFPGGPALDALADRGDARAVALPVPMRGVDGLEFSYSGLKTAVRYLVAGGAGKSAEGRADLAASFRRVMAESLADRVARALAARPSPILYLTGGVAANATIRARVAAAAAAHGARFLAPPPEYATDNAAMVGASAWTRIASCDGRIPHDAWAGTADAGWELPGG